MSIMRKTFKVIFPETKWKASYKHLLADVYMKFLDMRGSEWAKPKYDGEPEESQFIPTEKELQLAINIGSHESIVFSQFLYETDCRPNEAKAFK